MAQQLTTSTPRMPRVGTNAAGELWVLVIEEQDRPDHSFLRRLNEWMMADVAREPVVPFALAFESLFDAILVTRSMEGSLALLRILRGTGITTPIVVLNESVSVNYIVNAIEAGADDVLPATVGGEMLVARLRSLQRRTAFNRSTSTNAAKHAGSDVLDGQQRMLA